MRRTILLIYSLISFSCFLFLKAELVFAGRISLSTDTRVSDLDKENIQILITTKNVGDPKDPVFEEAKNVYPVVILLGKKFPKNDLQLLFPGKSYRWEVVIPKSELEFKSVGTYPVIIKVLYQDRNGANFSNIFDSKYNYQKETYFEVDGRIDRIVLPEDKDADATEGILTLRNKSDKKIDVNISYYFPDEIQVLESVKAVSLPPNAMKDVAFKIKNFSGLDASDYEVKVVMESDDGKEHFCSTAKTFVHISASKSFINIIFSSIWFYVAVGSALIIVVALLIPSKKKD